MWSFIQDPALGLACPAVHSGHMDCLHFSKSSRFFFFFFFLEGGSAHLVLCLADSAHICHGSNSENSSSSFRIQFKVHPLGVSRQNDPLPPLCSTIPVTVLLLPLLTRLLCVATWSLAVPWVNTHRWSYNNSVHLCFIDGASLVQRGHVSSLWNQR